MSDKMSDMGETIYTLRDLNRKSATVLRACDLHGQVEIRARNGKTYLLQAGKHKRKKKRPVKRDFEAHWKRMRELGYVPPAPEEEEWINRIVAGEE
jgi:hypothetical protein